MLLARNRCFKYLFLFLAGGFAYGGVEIIFRGFSHITMFVTGGICFLLIGMLNQAYTWNMALVSQMVISGLIVTAVEFTVGLIVNVWLKLNVWDYSKFPYNIMGQVCLLYTNMWFFLALPAILFDDFLRYFLLKEEQPHYKLL